MRAPEVHETGWIDGERAPLVELRLTVDDPALLAGLGLFETLAVEDGRLLELDQHLARLQKSAKRIRIPLPSEQRLREVVLAAAAARPPGLAWLKIVVARSGRWFVFCGEVDPAEVGCSVSAVLLPWRRNPRDPVAGLKTLNYAASVLGAEHATQRGADEGLWLNTRGHLAEGCTSNLFVVDGGKLYTPGVRDGILAGVVRSLVIDAAGLLGITVHEGKTRLRRLERADEAFLTSSVRGVRPLVRFEGKPVGRGDVGAVTRALTREVARMRAKETTR